MYAVASDSRDCSVQLEEFNAGGPKDDTGLQGPQGPQCPRGCNGAAGTRVLEVRKALLVRLVLTA